MYKLWESKNCSNSAIKKILYGTIISGNLLVQKSLIDDIINALDGFEPGLVTNSANWKNWIA